MGNFFYRDQDLLDWTFAETPPADEAQPYSGQPPAPGRPPAPRLGAGRGGAIRHAGLLTVALAGIALAIMVAFPGLEAWRTRRAIEALIKQQEQARLAGDWAGVRGTFKNPGGGWADGQLQHLTGSWQAAAFGLPGARLAQQPGWISQYQTLDAGQVRVEVARSFVLADGGQATFALPQYYQFSDGAWRQAPAPPTPTGDLEALHRAQVDVHYNPADAELAAHVADDLQLLLTRACADWGCPADLRVAVIFGVPDPIAETYSGTVASLSGSLTFQMLAAGGKALPGLVVRLPTRELGGYPADANAAEAVRRVVAVQALANVAKRLSGGVPAISGPVRPFLYALVVRELARLGVEPAQLGALKVAKRIDKLEALWSQPAPGPAAWQALPEALALLDGLLADRSLADEGRWLHSLEAEPDTVAWVANGLGLGPAEAQARLARLGPP